MLEALRGANDTASSGLLVGAKDCESLKRRHNEREANRLFANIFNII